MLHKWMPQTPCHDRTTAMSGFWSLNLIHFFDFYLMLAFLAGMVRRYEQYQSIGRLMLTGPTRWPRLLELVHAHRTIFLTWETVLPGLLAFGLWLAQLVASRQVWPHADLTSGQLADHWLAVVVVAPLGLAMVCVDLYGILFVGQIDRALMEKYFEQAEYWLRSRTAHVVRVFTFGMVNPRQMVNEEVRKALVQASEMLNSTLWWVTLQIGLRVAFGLSLWLTWALTMA
jgi:hypothetical protein